MPIVMLNDRKIAGLQPTGKPVEYFDRGFPAFAVRVWPSGKKSFVLFYRQYGRLRRLTIGRYPLMSLASARAKARAAVVAVSEGRDPGKAQQEAKARTFGALSLRYLEKYAKKRKRSWQADARTIRCELTPQWEHRPVESIRRADVRELVEAIAERPAPVFANRVLALVRKMFNYAIDQDWLDANPAARLQARQERSRARVLTDDEIRQVWQFFDTPLEDPDPVQVRWTRLARAALALRFLTAQRFAEVLNMRRQDLDGDWWTIPAAVSKNGLAHRVYLTPLAKALIERVRTENPSPSPYVFVGVRGARQRNKMLHGLTIANFQPRDLRRTAATKMRAAGVDRLTVKKVLNHVDTDVTAVYDRYAHDAEIRAAWLTWDAELQRILAEPPVE